MKCPYCNSDTKFMDSKKIYGKSYGMVWACINYPKCDAFVGVHKGTNKPLGRLANAELREYKKKAHAAFDPLWKDGGMKRIEAYGWLSKQLELPMDETHIGMFDIDMCKKVITVCSPIMSM